MALKIKEGVILSGLQSPMVKVLPVANDAFNRQGLTCTITSGLDGVHKFKLHGLGLALDFRTRNMPDYALQKVIKEIRSNLSRDYDVVLEFNPPHLHIEFDRKKSGA